MNYISVIKNECGEVVRVCSNYSDKENQEFLNSHPEFYKNTEPFDCDHYNEGRDC